MGKTSNLLSPNQKSKKITKLSPADYDQYLTTTCNAVKASLDPGDWRSQLYPDSRQRIVDMIMDESKRHLPFSGPEEEYQIERTAARFEEEVYVTATSQSDYLQKISLKLLSMKFNPQKVPFNDAGTSNRLPSSDSTGQTGHGNVDWQEEVYQKIKVMKEMYFPELNEMLVKINAKLLEHDLLRQQLTLERIEKLRIFKNMLERIIAFLLVSKDKISPGFKGKLGSYEKQIINFINTNRPKKPASSLQQGQLPPSHRYPMQQKVFCHTNLADMGDWQEEVYQKIKAMKEMYLPELNEMYQKIATKLQQHDVLPQQPKSDQLEKLKIFKTMLERVIAFLQVSKNNISPSFKEKLGSYEKQIINFITTNRPRKPVSSLEQG